MPDNLLSLKEVAAKLKVNKDTVARMIRHKVIPGYALNGLGRRRVEYRVKESDLQVWLESKKL